MNDLQLIKKQDSVKTAENITYEITIKSLVEKSDYKVVVGDLLSLKTKAVLLHNLNGNKAAITALRACNTEQTYLFLGDILENFTFFNVLSLREKLLTIQDAATFISRLLVYYQNTFIVSIVSCTTKTTTIDYNYSIDVATEFDANFENEMVST